eukprot:CAMPEP_0195294326 /NCGR_PEP_ID=MMETSP0707-20130614/14678_1 /TAXON_ID=33640 /ORGANISM="Asterionellopsis glacialis, Strain CCMP134" /LENGTH=234 /DNA_ID=CAMNT_0040355265 /DNA_START=51 /DNA_END=755 /DNA_ORIENTATION=+
MRSFALASLICLVVSDSAHGWSVPSQKVSSGDLSRREVMKRASAVLLGGGVALVANPGPSFAESVPKPSELVRLQKGHSRVQYLLENWDALTNECGTRIMSDLERKQVIRTEGGGGEGGQGTCEKTPLRVQEFLGYKSTEDPLFKADKLMVRAAPLVDPDQFEEYLDIVEQYREKADQGAMMAYTSSWGEANPNGGKEVVDEYLEKTKAEVKKTEKLLRSTLGYLNLEVLPPSK